LVIRAAHRWAICLIQLPLKAAPLVFEYSQLVLNPSNNVTRLLITYFRAFSQEIQPASVTTLPTPVSGGIARWVCTSSNVSDLFVNLSNLFGDTVSLSRCHGEASLRLRPAYRRLCLSWTKGAYRNDRNAESAFEPRP
jgi:hypothetical protein